MNTDRFLRGKVISTARTLLVSLAVTSAPGPFLASGQQPASSPGLKQSGGAVVIPMELLANRPLVRVRINGQGPFAFLVAPEAQATLIDQTLAAELKLKSQNDRTATSQLELEMEFGTTKLLKPLVQFADAGESCTIGGRQLIGFSITYDRANARVQLAPQRLR